jgi:hypothetical protein
LLLRVNLLFPFTTSSPDGDSKAQRARGAQRGSSQNATTSSLFRKYPRNTQKEPSERDGNPATSARFGDGFAAQPAGKG